MKCQKISVAFATQIKSCYNLIIKELKNDKHHKKRRAYSLQKKSIKM